MGSTTTMAPAAAARDHGPGVRCRRIEAADVPALAALLAKGFPAQGVEHWREGLQRAQAWAETRALPGIGFVLADGEALVGCLLTFYSADGRRCNFSSWHVAEGYRRFGTILVSAALRDRSLTYLNISSEAATRPIIEAQGFRRYADGVVLACPIAAIGSLARGRIAWNGPGEGDAFEAEDIGLMADHKAFGCITFWCRVDGRAYPFVAVRRLVGNRLPVAQIVYCSPDTDWRRLAGSVGRALARHGLFLLTIDADAAIPGLPGRFMPGRMPKYARGPQMPRLGDLAYTEAATIGT